jgi:hypothetical protein
MEKFFRGGTQMKKIAFAVCLLILALANVSHALTAAESITRMKENEARIDLFTNSTGTYTTRYSTTVETLPSFIIRKDQEVSERYILNVKGDWITETAYIINDLVIESDIVYLCIVAHTSGTFATDLAAGKWVFYQGLSLDGIYYANSLTAFIAACGAAGVQEIILTAPITLAAPLSCGDTGTGIRPIPGAAITTNGNVLTIGGAILGDPQFTWLTVSAPGEVLGLYTARPEWFGADPTGSADSAAAFEAAEGAMPNGGLILGAGPNATYKISSDVTIETSYITVDLQWATLIGGYRFLFDGDSGVNGDWSDALYGVHFRNAMIGTANTFANTTRGPSFNFCLYSGMENIIKRGFTITAFNISRSKYCYAKNIINEGSLLTDDAIGILSWLSDYSYIENCHVRDGSFIFGIQFKGGVGNTAIHCSVEDQRDSWTITFTAGANEPAQGDIITESGGDGVGVVRYVTVATGSWAGDDATGTIYASITTPDFDASSTIMHNTDVVATVNASTRVVDVEKAFYDRGDNPADASNAYNPEDPGAETSPTTISLGAPDDSRGTYDSQWIHCRAENSDGVGFYSMQSQGTVWDHPVAKNVAGGVYLVKQGTNPWTLEKNFTILNPDIDTVTEGYGIEVISYELASPILGVQIRGGRVRNSHKSGVYAEFTDHLLISDLEVLNSDQEAGTGYGIYVKSSVRPTISGCIAADDQTGSETQDRGIFMATTVTYPTIINCRAWGNNNYQIISWLPGWYSGNQPADGLITTASATPVTTAWRMTMTDGDVVYLKTRIIANNSDDSEQAFYEVGGLYKCASGVASLIGSLQTPVTIESDAAWAATFAVTGADNIVYVTLTGDTGTIYWRVFAEATIWDE